MAPAASAAGPEKKIARIPLSEMDVKSASDPSISDENRARIGTYLESQARAGRSLDQKDVRIASASASGASVGAVLEKGDEVKELVLAEASGDLGSVTAVGAAAVSPAESVANQQQAGFDAATSISHAAKRSYGCRSLFLSPTYSSSVDHYIYDCYEKFQSTSTTTWWLYNRYTLFDAANGSSGWRGEIVDATVRFRPWSGYESRVVGGPYNYAPKPSSSCNTSSIGFSFGGASLQVPLVNCSASFSELPNGTAHSMGTDFDGRTTGQVYLDSTGTFKSNGSTPIFADYDWLEVQYYFLVPNCGAGPSQYLTFKDSGW